MKTPNTEAIDKLFLELSQFATAKTKKELDLEKRLAQWIKFASYCRERAQTGDRNPEDFQAFINRSSLN